MLFLAFCVTASVSSVLCLGIEDKNMNIQYSCSVLPPTEYMGPNYHASACDFVICEILSWRTMADLQNDSLFLSGAEDICSVTFSAYFENALKII